MANAANGDLYISVHNNSSPVNPNARGTEVYYYSRHASRITEIYSKHLGRKLVYRELGGTLGTEGRGVKERNPRMRCQ